LKKVLTLVIISLLLISTFSIISAVFATKFSLGDIVEVINTLNVGLSVRDAPAGNIIGKKYDGSRGMILDGPQAASLGGIVYTWWKVRWGDDALEGWSAEGYPGGVDYLMKVYISPSTKFSIGNIIKVYNTGAYGLIVRTDPPTLSYVGKVYDNTVGRILDGPFYGVPEGKAGFYHFWKVYYWTGIVGWSAEDWLTWVVGEPTITSSLTIVEPPPSPPYYYVGDTITAQFTIKNKADVQFTFDVLTVGGRDPDGQVADFTWIRSITLNPGESYNYRGTLTLTKVGNYHFFCAYRTPDGVWNPAIPTESGVINVKDITVIQRPTLPPNQWPTLENGYVTPSSGTTSTIFKYYVTYKDPDGDAPTVGYVYIDNSPYIMTKVTGDYVSGATFIYSTCLPIGSHSYYFLFDDGHGHTVTLPTSGTYPGPNVSPLPAPDLDIVEPLQFLDDISPPFLPNALKVRAIIVNKGDMVAQQPVIRFFLDGKQIGTIILGPLEPGKQAEAKLEFTVSSNVEDGKLEVKAELIDQEDANPIDNIATRIFSFYFVNFRYDRDAFSFSNSLDWKVSASTFFDDLATVTKGYNIPSKALTLLSGWLAEVLSGAFAGHCYGMASASVHWYVRPEDKPIQISVYEMTLEQEEVKASIIKHHWAQLLSLLKRLQELKDYNAEVQYDRILNDIRGGFPVVLAIGTSHAVTAYGILDMGDEKYVYVYDNEVPLKLKQKLDYAVFKISSNEGLYYGSKVIAIPLEYSLYPEQFTSLSDFTDAIKQATKDLWNKAKMFLWFRSPVTSLITDEFGRRVGYVEGNLINEIPGAIMKELFNTQLFYLPTNLNYSVEITGTDIGTLELYAVVPRSDLCVEIVNYVNISITPGLQATSILSVEKAVPELKLSTGEVMKPTSVSKLNASDIIPPSTIINLIISNITANSVTLTWTAPGDDGNLGTASQYDIRYLTEPITEDNWNKAIQCVNVPTPKPAGSKETFIVTGLNSGTTYYFAIKTADEIPNWSELSNIVKGATLLRDIAIIEVLLSTNVTYAGRKIDINVTVSNLGDITETFNVSLYYNDMLIDTILTENLNAHANKTLTFIWNTAGVEPCNYYNITAKVDVLPGEANTTNNILVDGKVKIKMVGDVNGDGKVDMRDIAIAAKAFGSYPGHERWNPDADITGQKYLTPDDMIDMRDIANIARHFGECA
jgi:hypothetical protein